MATLKQQKAAKILVENGGSVSGAMRKAGYDPKTAKTPKKLTESKGYKELMDEIIPDSFLTKKHKELLNVPRKIRTRTYRKGEETEVEEIEELDVQAISRGLDMAYKVKGHYAAEKIQHSGLIDIPYDKQSQANEAIAIYIGDTGRR